MYFLEDPNAHNTEKSLSKNWDWNLIWKLLAFQKILLINKQVLGKTICPFQKTITIFAQNIKSYMAIDIPTLHSIRTHLARGKCRIAPL